MAKEKNGATAPHEGVISIIGPGMRVTGDCETEGTLRVEGAIDGTVRAGKAVVIGKDGIINGDIFTQDAVIGGRVVGTILAESRLELQATCIIDGEIHARRIKLDEGGRVNGTVRTGDIDGAKVQTARKPLATQPLQPLSPAASGGVPVSAE
jgi:cytoskeletal protein CcmA (bactofilin family)